MTVQSSISNHAVKCDWLYTRPAFGRTGRSLSENNFAKERRDWVAILLREVLQNGLDARLSTDSPVIVKISQRTLTDANAAFVRQLITNEHLARFKESVPHIHEVQNEVRHFLVIEDFGTTGLTGVTDSPDVDGRGQNWNAFWFREGEGGKEHGSGNGGAGQGKITYFSTSAIRTIFAYTVRNDDHKEALYGASSFLRDYEYNSMKWLRDSYWGLKSTHDETTIAIPTDNSEAIKNFREKLGVTRLPDQPGLSLLIPSPKQFNFDAAIEITIAEFFIPILRGDLVVQFDEALLDSETIMSMADSKLSDEQARKLNTCTTRGYRQFVKGALEKSKLNQVEVVATLKSISEISEAVFTETALAKMRESLNSNDSIGVRFSVQIKPKEGQQVNCDFDVHLMCPDGLEHVEQAIIRRDLLIGEEPVGGGSLRQKARGLTLINHSELSKLLLSAEEATHLRWNTRLPRLREYYKSGEAVVSFVRNAMSKLLEVLAGGDQKPDFRLLAKFFPSPGSVSQQQAKGKKSPDGNAQPIVDDIPPPVSKKIILQALDDGCRVVPSYANSLTESDLPIEGNLEFAYEGLDKDAYAEYDPLDFDLTDTSFKINDRNCNVESRKLNTIAFTVLKPDFALEITGFDKNLRLRARLNYKEASDATTVNAE